MSADEYVPDEEQVRAWCRDGAGDYPDVMDEWLDRFLARVKRDALAAAEHRATRAEAQSDIRGRAVVIYRARAREAEARIKAVQDLIDQADTAGDWTVTCSRLQWAIDGTNPYRASETA